MKNVLDDFSLNNSIQKHKNRNAAMWSIKIFAILQAKGRVYLYLQYRNYLQLDSQIIDQNYKAHFFDTSAPEFQRSIHTIFQFSFSYGKDEIKDALSQHLVFISNF